jgi:hypothetical protein
VMPHDSPQREPWPSRKGPGKRRARPDQQSRRPGPARSRECHATSIGRARRGRKWPKEGGVGSRQGARQAGLHRPSETTSFLTGADSDAKLADATRPLTGRPCAREPVESAGRWLRMNGVGVLAQYRMWLITPRGPFGTDVPMTDEAGMAHWREVILNVRPSPASLPPRQP